MKSRGKNREKEDGKAKDIQPRWWMRDDRRAAVGVMAAAPLYCDARAGLLHLPHIIGQKVF